MKKYALYLPLILLLFTVSCQGTQDVKNLKDSDITGVWTLFKEEKQGKTIDYSGVPSATRIEFIENGYFILFDQITDEKINSSGIGSIQDKFKGQYELKDGHIRLNHYVGDSLIKQDLELLSMEGDVMVIKDPKGKVSHFKR